MHKQRVSDHRTQVYLPSMLYQQAKHKASSEGVSLAQLIREALVEKIKVIDSDAVDFKSKNPPTLSLWDSVKDVAGSIHGGPSDMSVNISKYIRQMYEEKYP